jgi:hypothetical protein
MSRQKQLLIILLVGLALSMGYAFWAMPRQQRLPESATGTVTKSARSAAAPQEENTLQVHLHLLARDQQEVYRGFRRNIFAPLNRPAISASPPPAVVVAPPVPVMVPVQTVDLAQQEQEEVRRELARFTFLGFLQKDAVKTVFLSSAGEIFVVKRGDRFGQGREFLITHISNEMLQVRQGDDPRIITVPLVEQAPLAEARPAPPASPRPAVFPSRPPEAGFGRRFLPPPPPVEESFPPPEPQVEVEEAKHD